eukprot:403367636
MRVFFRSNTSLDKYQDPVNQNRKQSMISQKGPSPLTHRKPEQKQGNLTPDLQVKYKPDINQNKQQIYLRKYSQIEVQPQINQQRDLSTIPQVQQNINSQSPEDFNLQYENLKLLRKQQISRSKNLQLHSNNPTLCQNNQKDTQQNQNNLQFGFFSLDARKQNEILESKPEDIYQQDRILKHNKSQNQLLTGQVKTVNSKHHIHSLSSSPQKEEQVGVQNIDRIEVINYKEIEQQSMLYQAIQQILQSGIMKQLSLSQMNEKVQEDENQILKGYLDELGFQNRVQTIETERQIEELNYDTNDLMNDSSKDYQIKPLDDTQNYNEKAIQLRQKNQANILITNPSLDGDFIQNTSQEDIKSQEIDEEIEEMRIKLLAVTSNDTQQLGVDYKNSPPIVQNGKHHRQLSQVEILSQRTKEVEVQLRREIKQLKSQQDDQQSQYSDNHMSLPQYSSGTIFKQKRINGYKPPLIIQQHKSMRNSPIIYNMREIQNYGSEPSDNPREPQNNFFSIPQSNSSKICNKQTLQNHQKTDDNDQAQQITQNNPIQQSLNQIENEQFFIKIQSSPLIQNFNENTQDLLSDRDDQYQIQNSQESCDSQEDSKIIVQSSQYSPKPGKLKESIEQIISTTEINNVIGFEIYDSQAIQGRFDMFSMQLQDTKQDKTTRSDLNNFQEMYHQFNNSKQSQILDSKEEIVFICAGFEDSESKNQSSSITKKIRLQQQNLVDTDEDADIYLQTRDAEGHDKHLDFQDDLVTNRIPKILQQQYEDIEDENLVDFQDEENPLKQSQRVAHLQNINNLALRVKQDQKLSNYFSINNHQSNIQSPNSNRDFIKIIKNNEANKINQSQLELQIPQNHYQSQSQRTIENGIVQSNYNQFHEKNYSSLSNQITPSSQQQQYVKNTINMTYSPDRSVNKRQKVKELNQQPIKNKTKYAGFDKIVRSGTPSNIQ